MVADIILYSSFVIHFIRLYTQHFNYIQQHSNVVYHVVKERINTLVHQKITMKTTITAEIFYA